MRILIIGPGKLKYMPYAHFYLDHIDWSKHDVHIAYWNRDCKSEDVSSYMGITLHEFRCFMNNEESLKTKFKNFLKYRKFCKILMREHYDLLIILHSLCGMMIYDLLRFKKLKYILDYRDSTYESKNRLFAKIVSSLAEHSEATFVSSDSFRRFLPEKCSNKIFTSHNLLEDSLRHRDYEKEQSDKIRLAFWGFIRHIEINRQIIESVSKDNRLELHYYGREQKDALALKAFAKSIRADNVYFHGEYIPEDRYTFAARTDLIHNIYSVADENMAMAMGNKYYDSIIFRIPQICQIGSFMGQMSENGGVGIELDPYDINFCNGIVNYYQGLDKRAFNKACDNELDRVLKEYRDSQWIIKEIVNNK